MSKIVHICLSGIVTDGFLYQDNLLSKYHRKMGYDVSFITSQLSYDKGKIVLVDDQTYINKDGVKFIRLKLRRGCSMSAKIKSFLGVYEALKIESPDILFIHGPQFVDMRQVVKYVKKNNVAKIYLDSHADFSNSGRNFISKNLFHKLLWKHMAQMILPYCNKIYGVLPARVDFLCNMYGMPHDKTELLVMGADDDLVLKYKKENWREKIREKYNINSDDLLIVTGGKIDAFKKQTITLMNVVNRIEDSHVKLLVFGSVDDDIKEKVINSQTERVKYCGWISPYDSYGYFEAADLIVFPGRHSVFWEQAVGQRKPLICKKWEGTTHVDIGGNVLFIDDDSESTLYNIINNVCHNRFLYESMLSAANSDKSKSFLYSQIAKKSIEVE